MINTNQITNARWHSDASHAWLEVSRAEVIAVGAAHLLSEYSYGHLEKCYLEEDVDAGIMLYASLFAGRSVPKHIPTDGIALGIRNCSRLGFTEDEVQASRENAGWSHGMNLKESQPMDTLGDLIRHAEARAIVERLCAAS